MNKLTKVVASFLLMMVFAVSVAVVTPTTVRAESESTIEESNFIELIQKIQELLRLIEELTILVNKINPQPPVEPPVEPPIMPVLLETFTLSDVSSVSVEEVNPEERAVDGSYYVYTITLKDGHSHRVEVHPNGTFEMNEKAFFAVGFEGDVEELMALAEKKDTSVDDSVEPEITKVETSGMKVALTIKASRIEMVTACGPIFFAQIAWGDSTTADDVYGLGCSAQRQTLTAEHTYDTAGTYTIYVSDEYGNQIEKTITVGGDIDYTINDVEKVTVEYVDPIKEAIDDEHSLYTVYLEGGTTREVEVYGMATWEMNQENFYRTGFSGDVQKLMDMAK